jgi:predicted negative regulator of RcsB-dependent stress response
VGILTNLGDVLEAQGKLQEALDAYQEGLTIAKRLADQDKSNAR